MKMLISSLVASCGMFASIASAEVTVSVDGSEVALSTLMDECKSLSDTPEAQIACFGALSKLLEEQSSGPRENEQSVSEAFEALRTVAQYQDGETGLTISADSCKIQIVYFANYFHISRRNVSSIDLFSANFDASQFKLDEMAESSGQALPLSKGVMDAGATAAFSGGVALDSSEHNFSPKSARTALDIYANEVASELTPREDQAFDFVLVHPQRSGASADIWDAFKAYVTACQQ